MDGTGMSSPRSRNRGKTRPGARAGAETVPDFQSFPGDSARFGLFCSYLAATRPHAARHEDAAALSVPPNPINALFFRVLFLP